MEKGRLEAFSDGVIAVIITIMVLELHIPHGSDWADLVPQLPKLLCYVLSFIHVGIYWNNHHHMFQAVQKIGGPVLWANLHLLFWLSLLPVATDWMGENNFQRTPVVMYGGVLMMCGIAYYFLVLALLRRHAPDSLLARAIGRDWKGKLSVVFYLIGIALAFLHTWLAIAMYLLVAAMWFIPDTRIESHIEPE